MRIFVHMNCGEDYSAMVQVLSTWAAFLCVHIEISPWPQELPAAPAILFWDLDSENGLQLPPIQPSHALFLCSSAPQAAISSYSLHPTSFLCKPVSLSALQRALDLCTDLWWGCLDRLEIPSGRHRISLPLCNLVWAEGARRGCIIHSSQECIPNRETLSMLEERLPQRLFLRPHRSFLVNLYHVRSLDGAGLHMSDGAVIPLGRSNRKAYTAAYHSFCRWRNGLDSPIPEEVKI